MEIIPVAVAPIEVGRLLLAAWLRRRSRTMSAETTAPRKLLNTCGLAKELGVSDKTVRKMTREGRIPCVAISERTRRYDLEEVRAALKAPAAGREG